MDGIVVGVDRSPGAQSALRWALRDGALRHLPVTAVHAWSPLSYATLADAVVVDEPLLHEQVGRAQDVVQELVNNVRSDAAGTSLSGEAVQGPPVSVLLDAAVGSEELVVGCRGMGGFARLLLGSVSDQVTRHAAGTVTVVREDTDPTADGPVVVGVDGSEASGRALRLAAEQARARQVELRVVTVRLPVPVSPQVGVRSAYPDAVQRIEHAAHRLIENELREALGDQSDLKVDSQVLVGRSVAPTLLEAARDAQLLVLGRRGRGGFAGLLLGSVSSQCVHHANCPVSVVH